MSAIAAAQRRHMHAIQSLYRRCLRATNDWCDAETKFALIPLIRQSFEEHRVETDVAAIQNYILECERFLSTIQNPDTYKIPWEVDGTMFQRNPPPPSAIL